MNYSARAIEDLKKTKKVNNFNKTDLVKIDAVSWMLKSGQKFFLPTSGSLLDISVLKEEYNDLIKLPYPVCVLEFAGDIKKSISDELIYPKSYILILREAPLGGIIIQSIYEVGGWYCISPHTVFLERINASNNSYEIKVTPTLDVHKKLLDDNGYSQNSMLDDVNLDICVASEFMIAVNTKNVTKDKILPSEKLNKKRCKNGKEPYDSYWVLDILKEEHERVVNGGTHSSPRQHFRRGHLRRLQNGDVVWVRHCLVGNRNLGVVDKSYSLI